MVFRRVEMAENGDAAMMSDTEVNGAPVLIGFDQRHHYPQK